MSSLPLHPPPPVLYLRKPELLPIIQAEIKAPPDPAVLPWEPPPDYDPQAVSVRVRLDRSARDRANAPVEVKKAPTRVQSSFGPAPKGPIDTGGGVDFSTSGSFFAKAEVGGTVSSGQPPEPEPESAPRFAFGEALGARARKKDEEGKKRPRGEESDILARLKTNWLQSSEDS